MGAGLQLHGVGAGVGVGLGDRPAQRADRAVRFARVGGEGGEQSAPGQLCGRVDGNAGLDAAGGEFEVPVAAARCRAGGVGAGGDVGAGQGGKHAHQRRAVAAGDIAAVEQDVGLVIEGLAPQGDLVTAPGEGVGVERGAAQPHLAGGAVRDQVQRGDLLPAGQCRIDAGDAVFAAADDDSLERDAGPAGGEVGEQGVDIGNGGVDEHDFAAHRLRRGGGRFRRQRVVAAGVEHAMFGGAAVGRRIRAGQHQTGGQVGRVQDARLDRLGDRAHDDRATFLTPPHWPGSVWLVSRQVRGRCAGRGDDNVRSMRRRIPVPVLVAYPEASLRIPGARSRVPLSGL